MTLRDCLDVSLSWSRTGKAEFPYTTSVAGRGWLIRVNDFPAEAFYTLFINGQEIGDFDDWPSCWQRPD